METRLIMGTKRLEILQGDISACDVDAIVCPSNEQLRLGAGVSGDISRRGGPEIQAACDRLGGLAVGEAVLTGAGKLVARHVIHAVGPRVGQGSAERLLERTVQSALRVASSCELKSVALPAISTGAHGVSGPDCARVTLNTCGLWLQRNRFPQVVNLVIADWGIYRAFGEELTRLLNPPIPDPEPTEDDDAPGNTDG